MCLVFLQTHLWHRENREHEENWSLSGLRVALGRSKGVERVMMMNHRLEAGQGGK